MTLQSTNPNPAHKQVPQKATSRRKPRTKREVNIKYVGSLTCVRCSINHRQCMFRNNSTQQCNACLNKGYMCQPIGTTFMHKRKESKLGRRIACNNCAALKKTCEYEEDTNEWDYNVSCTRCEKNGKCCWPNVNFRGMSSSKLLSGVDNAFVQNNDLSELLAHVTFEAAAMFKPTVDHPLGFDAIISTRRPRRARNNYGDTVNEEIKVGDHFYQEIVSYGSGCGASSVGTTYK